MPKPLSPKMRELIVYHKEKGATNAETAELLQVNAKSVKRIWKRYREENTIVPKPQNSGRKAAFCEAKLNKIAEKIREQPDVTLEELVEVFSLNISISALSRKLIQRNLSFKKRRYFVKNSSARTCNGFAVNG
jgi:transposase